MNSQTKTSTCLSVIWLYDGKVAQNMKRFSLRPVIPGCAGCAMAHPDFGRSADPISTKGDRLCPPNYLWHTRIFRPSDGPVV